MRIQTETRTLPTELSPEDLAEESKKLATAVEEVAKQKDAIAEKTGLWRETKKKMEGYLGHLEGEMNALAEVVDSGKADREVDCSWLYALKEGYGFLVRDDTGELVHHRKLRDEERQTDLLEVVREPTPAQLEAWTASLGLVIDAQGDLPLAAPEDGPVAYYRHLSIPGEHGPEQIIGRFAEADHRPSSLTGVYLDAEGAELEPEGLLAYDDDAGTLHTYRQALEEMLETKRDAAQRLAAEGGSITIDDEPEAPTPIGRGRKGK